MIGLKQSYEIEYDGTENCARMELYADTAADLQGLTHYDSIKLLQGSDTLDISTGDHWIMQSGGSWIRQPSANAFDNVYTKAEIDNILTGYQELLSWDPRTIRDSANSITSGDIWSSIWGQILDLNTYPNLAAGDDLNNFTTPGIYRCTNSTTAAALLNMPSALAQQAGGRLIVSTLGGSGRIVQIYISAGARFWIRSNTAAGFQHWFEYAGTDTGA